MKQKLQKLQIYVTPELLADLKAISYGRNFSEVVRGAIADGLEFRKMNNQQVRKNNEHRDSGQSQANR